ncbi:exodeoxyribonuclease VII small subunit [Sphingobacterium spiritivorum]|uniref:Exodeoxyribonuclease VII small subunit n=1 Tax=Sphingobacterium spiritivorum TaxID=258 RepID=A0A380C7U9_SPHSI|nr:exodeoxyribonuclease VII small subunit [Sphingobacterium spiritivorum]SUJ14502.1 exodeoxyribonuclease VII small subunit [Sphingobacterium spiritivorum]
METNYSYTDAFNELQQIVNDISSGSTNIDELSEKIKRAALLIKACRTKLTSTEEEVTQLLANLAPAESPANPEEE